MVLKDVFKFLDGGRKMNVIITFNKAVENVDSFLVSNANKKEIRFPDGFYLEIIKHFSEQGHELEVHTSGYDGSMEISEALDLIKWTLIDYRANGILG